MNRVEHARRRWGADIIACILRASRGGVQKTDLMSRCNMSFAQLKNYLNMALDKQLIIVEKVGSNLLFRTSDKGEAYLESYENMEVLIN